MALRNKISLGMSLPHRSPDPLALTTIGTVARRAEELGFRDLWVTENTVDEGTCLDPIVALTYAASITNRIGVGAAVIVLPIHHPLTVANQWATPDFVSGGRAILAVGLGREHHYRDFQVPVAQRVRRFREEVELIKALWTEDRVTYRGQIYQVANVKLAMRPVSRTRPYGWELVTPMRCAGRHLARRRLDGFGWIEHCRVQGLGANSEAGFGSGRPRSRDVSRIQARVHGRRRAAHRGACRAQSLVHRGLPQSPRHGCLGHPRHTRAGARAARGIGGGPARTTCS